MTFSNAVDERSKARSGREASDAERWSRPQRAAFLGRLTPELSDVQPNWIGDCTRCEARKAFQVCAVDERVPTRRAELMKRSRSDPPYSRVTDRPRGGSLVVRVTVDAKGRARNARSRSCGRSGRVRTGSRRRISSHDQLPSAHLLPNYDEYLIAYKDRGQAVPASGSEAARANLSIPHHLIVDGRLTGGWKRTLDAGSLRVEVHAYRRLTPAESRALAAAVSRYEAS